ncbi:MAG: phosphotyrosine protein phosphatase [Planctomycetaceae bacterium]|nr:MAG: phosphotyrosine protein phosphatase [Planctomycetaceae bacterium]
MMPETLRYLFVCHANMDRSPTAEAVCQRIARKNGLDIEASSAGVSRRATRPVTKEMADLADKIFVMEPSMVDEMVERYGQNPAKIVCLDILDVYVQNDPVLVQRLEAKMYEYLAQEGLV